MQRPSMSSNAGKEETDGLFQADEYSVSTEKGYMRVQIPGNNLTHGQVS